MNKSITESESGAKIEANPDGSFAVSGELNHQSVPALLQESNGVLFNGNTGANADVAIDLAGVTRTDSAGVALLIEWMRQAKRRNHSIHFKNMPKQMHDIATVTGVDKMLVI